MKGMKVLHRVLRTDKPVIYADFEATEKEQERNVNEENTEAVHEAGTAEASSEEIAREVIEGAREERKAIDADEASGRLSPAQAGFLRNINLLTILLAEAILEGEAYFARAEAVLEAKAGTAAEDHERPDADSAEGVEVEGEKVAEQEECGPPDPDTAGRG